MKRKSPIPIGQAIKELRERNGLSQTQLGNRAGLICRQSVSKIETGYIQCPTFWTLCDIAKALGLKLSYLVQVAEQIQTQKEKENENSSSRNIGNSSIKRGSKRSITLTL